MYTRCEESADKIREIQAERKKERMDQREMAAWEPGGEEWSNYLEEQYRKFKENPWSSDVVTWTVNDHGVTGVEV